MKNFLRLAIFFVQFFVGAFCNASANLPRDRLFAKPEFVRPAISSSGRWVADIVTLPTPGIKLLDRNKAIDWALHSPVVASQVLWHKWARGPKDKLIVGAMVDGQYTILIFDPLSAQFVRAMNSDHSSDLTIVSPNNNYQFTLNRFLDKSSGRTVELASDGTMVPVFADDNLVPSDASPGHNLVRSGIIDGNPGWRIGKDDSTRALIEVTQADQRQGTSLISIDFANNAYFLSSAGRDKAVLLKFDMRVPIPAVLAEAPADIARVVLDPITLTPSWVEYDYLGAQVSLLDEGLKRDFDFLSTLRQGTPTIIDRSPNDQFWTVVFKNHGGRPVWAIYSRGDRPAVTLLGASKWWSPVDEPRIVPVDVSRQGQPHLTAYVSVPPTSVCRAKCPAVLMAHGGPGERDSSSFDRERHWLNSRGVVVIAVNYRGSRGFGKAYQALDVNQWDNAIPHDVLDAVRAASNKFPIDKHRIAVVGTSFSGTLALTILAKSRLFKCAVVDSFPADLIKFASDRISKDGEASDIITRVGDPRVPDQAAHIASISPLSRIGLLKAYPIMHFQGQKDNLVSAGTINDFVDRMLRVNPRYTFLSIPDESHGLLSSRELYRALTEQFLGECLAFPSDPLTAKETAYLEKLQPRGRFPFQKK